MKKHLEQVGNKDVNIKVNYNIDTSVDFLDVTIMNGQGRLRTTVYHKSAAETYILPFISDYPRHTHRNIPHAALLRAARLCSHVEDFDEECARLDMSLLLNDYPPSFVTSQIDRFFRLHKAVLVRNELDPADYYRLHQKHLHSSTRRELAIAQQIQDLIKSPAVLQEKKRDRAVAYPSYTFEAAYTVNFHDHFHKWWNYFYRYPRLPVRSVTVYLTAATHQTLDQQLINKKPPRHILTFNKSRNEESDNQPSIS